MTKQEPFSVALFESVSHALRAEKLVKAAELPCKLIPVPRQLSSDCGVCLRFVSTDTDNIRNILSTQMDFFEIHSL